MLFPVLIKLVPVPEKKDSIRLGSTQVVVRTPQAEEQRRGEERREAAAPALHYWMDGVGRFGLEQSRASKAACAPPGRP